MAWLSELAGKAESLLNNLDEQTGVALRNHKKKNNGAVLAPSEISSLKRTLRKLPPNRSSQTTSTDTSHNIRNRIPLRETLPMKNLSTVPSTRTTRTGSNPKGSPPTGPPHKLSHSPGSHRGSPTTGSPLKGSPPTGSPHKGSPRTRSPSMEPPQSCRKIIKEKNFYYSLENPPMTLVSDVTQPEPERVSPARRASFPPSLKTDGEWLYKMQNLEIENIMLKNELNVTNKEFLELLFRLRKSEDGNNVDIAEVRDSVLKLQAMTTGMEAKLTENDNFRMNLPNLVNDEVMPYKKENLQLMGEVNTLRNTIQELEQKCKKLEELSNDGTNSNKKLESDLKHAQSTISELQSRLEQATKECRRLEKDWEAYKLRVKNMLNAKDHQIQSLQKGISGSNETEELKKSIESLKGERDELLSTTDTIKSQLAEMQTIVQKMETRQMTSDQVLVALRDALREERSIRNSAEAQCIDAFKQMKCLQIESNLAMENLAAELREKNEELDRLRQVQPIKTDASALNVADYDMLQESIESNKIQYLTQMLIQKQSKLEKLMAFNNTLKIQMQKLEKKCKAEVESCLSNNMNVVVHEVDSRHRARAQEPAILSALSVRLGIIMRRYPVVRLFIMFYVICLHFWVITVLFTSTPDYSSKPRL